MIKVENISVKYLMTYDRIQSVKEYLVQLFKGKLKYEEFWALKDISLEVKQGEVLGIIGHNGAGKSTLLKVISGILSPTEGRVTIEGTIVPMLELGSGFDYDLTGRENIFLNGAILGYSEKFLKAKYDDILKFSELDKFIDLPLRNYSSGMLMRLAFSIATMINPDILIVDEILAVGDADFQAKSKERMLELMAGGTTTLFVSHSIDQIHEICDRVIWLEHGHMKMMGDADEVCAAYQGKAVRDEVAALYVDIGDGFSDAHVISQKFQMNGRLFRIEFFADTSSSHFRYDPVSTAACALWDLEIIAEGQEINVLSTNGKRIKKAWYFSEEDARIEFRVEMPVHHVQICGKIREIEGE